MFYRSTKDKGHYHIVYFGTDGNIVATGPSSGEYHTHPWDSTLGVLVSGNTNHSHQLKETPLSEDVGIKDSDKESVEEILQSFRATWEFNREFNARALKNVDYYKGNQWSATVKSKLTAVAAFCSAATE